MGPRLAKIGILLLVMTVVLVGVTSCERKAESREPGATEAADVSQTGEAPGSGAEKPAPGETIVSAVTPGAVSTAPSGGAQATSASSAGTPVSSQPTATTAPAGATAEPPAPQPTSAATSDSGTAGYVWHTVQRGESLASIARRYGATWQAIAQANNLSNPNQIYAGQKLKIPTAGGSSGSSGGSATGCRVKHQVKPGEWVWQIARNYGVSPYDILSANGLTINTARTIYPGTVLCIP